MSNFLIFKAAFNNSATPAIGTYTAEGATAQFNKDTSISPDYYLYNTVLYSAVQWFIPTAETTDFEFVADILTREWSNRVTYFIIADSTGTTRMRMWSEYTNWYFENSDSTATTGSPEFIGTISPTTSGGFGVFHQFRVRVRKLTESSSSVEVYVDGTLKLTATAGAALITCAKIGFVGGVNSFGPGTGRGVKNAYVYDLSDGDVVNPGVLSGAFNRFISWMKSKFALKSDIPTVNNGALTIQKNGANVATFTANQSTNATANIIVPTKTSDLTNDSGFITEDNTKIPLAGSNQISGDLIPSTDNSIDIGSSTKNIKMLYTKGITIDGTQFLPSDYVPRSGGAVMTGTTLSRTVNDSDLIFRGGTNAWGNGAQLELCGKDFSKAGICTLTSHNGSDYANFSMRPDGTISVTHGAGKNVAYATSYNWVKVEFFGGDSRDNGSSLQLHGKGFADADHLYAGAFILQARQTFDYQLLGLANGTLTWNGQPIQTSSDQRLKQQIAEIDDKLLDAWADVNLVQFKYNDAVDEKGDKARLHTGYVVQQIDNACKEHGVDVSSYGLYCHEQYPQETEEVEVEQADGTKTKERKVIREANEHYSLRYTEALIVECKYLRRCIARLTARIEQLEKEPEAGK